MRISINGNSYELNEPATLADALQAATIEPKGIAVAVNETVVPKNEYSTRRVSDGDKILIIKAFYGG